MNLLSDPCYCTEHWFPFVIINYVILVSNNKIIVWKFAEFSAELIN